MEKILITGEIGWDVQPADIRAQLEKAKGKDLDIYLASPGGFVFDGIEIYNLIRDYKKDYPKSQIFMTIKGLAASMASYLAMNPAVDMIAAEDNAVFMIHNVWGGAIGDYREMRKTADVFEGLSDLLGAAYANKTGKKKAEIKTMMDEESWFFGSEILDAGFVDEIIKTDAKPEKASAVNASRAQFKITAEKLQSRSVDCLKIAALIKDYPQDLKPANNNPAEAREKTTEVKSMNFDELMAANPAAKIELDNRLRAEKTAGYEEGRKSMQAAVTAAGKYLAPESTYPAAIRSIAIDVLNGSKSVEALETTVGAFDAMKELNASAAAKGETESIGAAAGEQTPPASENGIITSEADMAAEVARFKNLAGRY